MLSDGVLIALVSAAGTLPALAVKVMLNGSAARSKRIEAKQTSMDGKLDGHIAETRLELKEMRKDVGEVSERQARIEGFIERRSNPGRPTI